GHGAMYADVDIKRAINNGEIPGPRIFASTRAMAPTGMYPIVSSNWELELPHGVEPVDGVDGARPSMSRPALMRTGAGTGAALGACAGSGVVSATVNVRPSGVRMAI